jgi:hypothetical protein
MRNRDLVWYAIGYAIGSSLNAGARFSRAVRLRADGGRNMRAGTVHPLTGQGRRVPVASHRG